MRYAEPRDRVAVARLLEASGIDLRRIEAAAHPARARGHLLVLDVSGEACGVVHIVIARDRELRGRLEFLVLDPSLARASGRAIQDRMTGVAVALCEAHGCTEINIAATSRNEVAAARQILAACSG